MAPANKKRKPPPAPTTGIRMGPARVRCPACQRAVPAFFVNSHLDLECSALKSTPDKESRSASNSVRENFGWAAGDANATECLQIDDEKISRKSPSQFGESDIVERQRSEGGGRLDLGFFNSSECASRSDDDGNEAQDVGQACDSKNSSTAKASPDQTAAATVTNGGSAPVASERCDGTTNTNSCSLPDPKITSGYQQNGAGQRDSGSLAVGHPFMTKTSSFLCRLPLPQTGPKGLQILEDFVTPEEEEHLLRCLDADIGNPWKISRVNGIHWGKSYGNHIFGDAKRRVVTQVCTPMPEFVAQYEERMRHLLPALKKFYPNEMNSIDYRREEGHYLRAHMDDRQLSGTVLVNLSLAGTCFMSYTRERGHQEVFRVKLPPRSLQVLTGESRYSYKHGIEKEDILDSRRVSMTFRQSVEAN